MWKSCWLAAFGLFLALTQANAAGRRIQALIVDGQNNHKWQETTPALKKLLEETGLFTVEVATSPPRGADMSGFLPDFSAYQVVISNYNGDPWPPAAKAAFEKYVRSGGGFVSYHAADNAFPEWQQYNEMIALGGWGDRNEKWGPYLRFQDGRIVRDPKPGPGGHHGKRHPFQVIIRDSRNPITSGLPHAWMHAADELYDSLRGPGEHLTLLATAYSDPATGGTGENEPMLFTVSYGKGRIFQTTLGHDLEAIRCVGFITTFERGAEWAATGRVTQKVPADFPAADRVATRP
ncbi:MAG TPA: ThuA domain-containing protein [Bryobacterales bacterium]|nr:ThuA domain-containing protein [Bryobacterales bacterium]